MMYTTPRIKKIYGKIQKKLFYMIPEKWDRVYLYASVEEGMNKLETGEMYFYYFPKGILKKDPVNVYEIPNKFNIDEAKYFKIADEFYGIIQEPRKECINVSDKAWSNVIISVENFKFKVEYGFQDLKNSKYNSYDRHIIFRYVYLNTSINTYNKKERMIIEDYIRSTYLKREKKEIYVEPIYRIEQNNVIDYQRENEEILVESAEKSKKPINFNYEIKNDYQGKKRKKTAYISEEEEKEKLEQTVKKQVERTIRGASEEYKNQILNFDKKN